MFARVAIVNRGEAAMRFIHAARELSVERGVPLTTIALCTAAERAAMFAREADEAVVIGGNGAAGSSAHPYLDHAELERALRESRADAVWVGWGFVAEQPEFADLCERIGVAFIGPPARAMRTLGDKVGAKRLAESVGVPVAPWSGGPVRPDQAAAHAAPIGYPLMVKASAGGGGRGIRVVEQEADLPSSVESASHEAESAFGDPSVFLERLVRDARHVEAQIVADDHGTVWALGVRDCSIQRRNQKVIEESASTALDAEGERRVREAAIVLAKAAGYRNAGTVEFLYQPESGELTFLEVNTRLQVEHTVTELTTGVDLVKLQIHVAEGGRLEGDPPRARGHAMEARLNAEDAENGFAPAPGKVTHLVWPSGPGVRVDTGISEGDSIPPQYDSMIAKVMAWGHDRQEARARLRRALLSTTAVVRGGTTNKSLLLALLDHPDVVAGAVDTGWLDRLNAGGGLRLPQRLDVALVAAAIQSYGTETATRRRNFLATAARGRPQLTPQVGCTIDLRHARSSYRLVVLRTGPERYRVLVDGRRIDVETDWAGGLEGRLTVGGRSYRVICTVHRSEAVVEVDGVPHRLALDAAGIVRAPSPGMVVAVPAEEGAVVEAGEPVAVIESMKMEVWIRAPAAGRVLEVMVASNTQVDAGTPLVRLEAVDDMEARGTGGPDTGRVDFTALEAGPRAPGAEADLRDARAMVLGFDYSAQDPVRLARSLQSGDRGVPADPDLLHAELGILQVFADLCMLSRNRRVDEVGGEEAHNPREYFLAYLRGLDLGQAGCPPSFVEKLSRALSHYGVDGFDRTDRLEESVHLIYKAQQRVANQLPIVTGLLERYLQHPAGAPLPHAGELIDTLDRLIVATQLRHPAVGDVARSARYQLFDRPLIDARRAEAFKAMRADLAALAAGPARAEHERLLHEMVTCPQPLIRLMSELGGGDGDAEARRWLVEVQTRRYYQAGGLDRVASATVAGRHVVTADLGDGAGAARVVATVATSADLDSPGPLGEAILQAAGEGKVLVDVYLRWTDAQPDPTTLADRVGKAVAGFGLGDRVERLTVSVSGVPQGAIRADRHRFFNYRWEEAGLVEQTTLRDLHPMIAERLQIWRLDRFHLARLPSPPDVYLFLCTGKDAPGDRRLVALAEIRDLTPLTDDTGTVVALPALEQVLASCVDGMRRARTRTAGRDQPRSQRLHLFAWPTSDVPVSEIASIVRRIAPLTEGLDVEQLLVQGWAPTSAGGEARELAVKVTHPPGSPLTISIDVPDSEPLQPLDRYSQKVQQAARRGTVYPYEIVRLLVRSGRGAGGLAPAGEFVEHDLDEDGRLVPVERPYGNNSSAIVVGTVAVPTTRYPEGVRRVVVLGDPTKALGSVAEPECRRINAALDLAESLGAPMEWFAVCSGAKISMDSGTENMDWVSRTLRRLIEFTQAGGEVNVVVTGINVGAQPYWNAEATMLMHTRGVLVMTPDSAMVLTGKQALEYSGGVSAEDNFGIGGYDRIMGPNGQAQYWAPDLDGACSVLMDHYELAYVAPGERFARQAHTDDPADRDIRDYPHHAPGCDFETVGDVFSPVSNPDRKKPFDIRAVMRSVVDQDLRYLERWAEMRDAETGVVYDAFIGGHPVALIGVESRPVRRLGNVPADGPETWTGGTLFPLSSKKVARGINAASGNRPLVVLANLSGFDGSPESLRRLQLEYGAEIGRAVVNFDGPIVFVVISRYHGGAFVVFSTALNDRMVAAAVEGSFASVIGGPPAAAVVFAGEVNARTDRDERVAALQEDLDAAGAADKPQARARLDEVRSAVRAEKLGEVAAEFEGIHNIERARRVGSLHAVIPASSLRRYLVDAVERGIRRCEDDAALSGLPS